MGYCLERQDSGLPLMDYSFSSLYITGYAIVTAVSTDSTYHAPGRGAVTLYYTYRIPWESTERRSGRHYGVWIEWP
jgi:hypothetical protein